MTLKYFQGFDQHTRISGLGLNPGGDDDLAPVWFGGTPVRLGYDEGFNEGRAFVQNEPFMLSSRAPALGVNGRVRIGFWVKAELANLVTSMNIVKVSVGEFGSGNKPAKALRVNSSGEFQFYEGDSSLDLGDALGTTTGSVLTSGGSWVHCEVYINGSTGEGELKINGVLVLSTNLTVETQTLPSNEIQLGGTGTTSLGHLYDLHFDHLYVTDGPELQGIPVEGVNISASEDRYEGGNGTRGTVILDGTRYVTEWDRALISSLNTNDKNVCNTVDHFFINNPATSSPWTENSLDSISAWGLCFQAFTAGSVGDDIRVDSVVLSWLDYNDGTPLIRFEKPGALTQFSGPWTKSNTKKTYAAHVRDVPRESVENRIDAESLFIGDDGCVLFSRSSNEDFTDPELVSTGITFAEEFREDYVDWERVLGVGESYDSYFEAGYGVYGDSDKRFENNFVTVNYEGDVAGGAYIQGLWDYAETNTTGRWSMRQQVYAGDQANYTHKNRRLKIRGRGRAIQLRVSNDGNKPFAINGWSMFVTANQQV